MLFHHLCVSACLSLSRERITTANSPRWIRNRLLLLSLHHAKKKDLWPPRVQDWGGGVQSVHVQIAVTVLTDLPKVNVFFFSLLEMVVFELKKIYMTQNVFIFLCVTILSLCRNTEIFHYLYKLWFHLLRLLIAPPPSVFWFSRRIFLFCITLLMTQDLFS